MKERMRPAPSQYVTVRLRTCRPSGRWSTCRAMTAATPSSRRHFPTRSVLKSEGETTALNLSRSPSPKKGHLNVVPTYGAGRAEEGVSSDCVSGNVIIKTTVRRERAQIRQLNFSCVLIFVEADRRRGLAAARKFSPRLGHRARHLVQAATDRLTGRFHQG